MNSSKEKLIIENLFSSTDVFARCIGIVQAKYFSPEYKPCMTFVKEYFEKYNAIPTQEIIKAETNTDLARHDITKDLFNYTCDSIEEFCRNSAIKLAIKEYMPEIDKGNEGVLYERLKTAMQVSLQKDMGVELYDNPEQRLQEYAEDDIYYSSGINLMDDCLDGGLGRGQLTLFSANSGGGKSVMLLNIAKYMSSAGMNVLYISLELNQKMVYLRGASMISKVSTKTWKSEIAKIAHEINKTKEAGAGSCLLKRLPGVNTANTIRSFLKLYELEYKRVPDVLIVDYLDVMQPNEGIKNLSISEQDKLKSEQLVEILEEYNMIGLSASQQNREAIKNSSPDQGVIAGGLSKINAVHNYISIYMDPIMRLNGEMWLFFLKTRTSSAMGQAIQISFNPNNLIISDSRVKTPPKVIQPMDKSGKKSKSHADEIIAKIKGNYKQMPSEVKQEYAALNENSKVMMEHESGQTEEVDLLTLIDTI